jgi:hypothetical protein
MKPKHRKCLLCVLLVFGGLGFIKYQLFGINSKARVEMLHLMERVPLNITKNQFDRRFTEGKYQQLELHQGTNLWSVRTPIEFGAKNWLLYAEFDGQNLVALRMRTPDDMRFRPIDNAPADVVLPTWKKPFPDVR